MIQLLYLVIVSTTVDIVQTHPSSDYSETKITSDKCEESFLLSTTARSSLDCGNTCGENPECRRFAFCSSDSTCILYQHGTDCILSGDSTSCTCYRKNIGRNGTDVTTCPMGYYGNNCQHVIEDCRDAYNRNIQANFQIRKILTYIKPVMAEQPFEVQCRFIGTGSMELLRRKPRCSYVNFNRSMLEYEQGFGKHTIENYWIGFNELNAVMYSRSSTYRLQIMLFKADWSICMTIYTGFQIGNKSSGYSFTSSPAYPSPNHDYCGDSMTGSLNLVGNPFSTYDADYTGVNQCAKRLGGGWWFEDSPNCTRSFLTGTVDGFTSDMFWLDDLDGELLKMVVIAIL